MLNSAAPVCDQRRKRSVARIALEFAGIKAEMALSLFRPFGPSRPRRNWACNGASSSPSAKVRQ